jgi:hypothetical protein
MVMLRRLVPLIVVVLPLLFAAPASAQQRFGLRAGASGSPGQFVFGAHVDTPELFDNFTFRPNIEVGVGDNRTLVGFNVEFAYWIPITDTAWKVYFPVGPALVITSRDVGGNGDGTEAGGGFNLGVGVQHARGFFTELKIGLVDSPEVRFSLGYVF